MKRSSSTHLEIGSRRGIRLILAAEDSHQDGGCQQREHLKLEVAWVYKLAH